MQVFKKRYRYIQKFDSDHTTQSESLLGFFTIGSADAHETWIQSCLSRVLLPHYGFSFYDNPPGRLIRRGKGDIPSVFQSNRLFNLGLNSLIKQVPSIDMFTDHGLSSYRSLNTLMIEGTAAHLNDDIGLLRHAIRSDKTDHGFEDSLAAVCSTLDEKSAQTFYERIHDTAAIYDDVFNLDTIETTGYFDFIYLTAETLTSLVLSHTTVQNIIRTKGDPLKPLYQCPFVPGDKGLMADLFLYDESRVKHVVWDDRRIELFGILPGIFGFEGALFDVATGLVSGKRNSLVRFLLLLNGLGLLAERDLRYLV